MDTQRDRGTAATRQLGATSRRALLRGAALGGAGLALGGLQIGKALADSSESLATIVNVALTAEHLAVTFYGNGIANAATLGITDPVDLGYLKAAQAAEQDHIDILELLGGQPLATTFSTPDGTKTFSDVGTFTTTLVALETAFVAAYLAAVNEAAAAGRADVAQLAARIASVEAEHKALARDIGGMVPADNTSFQKLLFSKVGDAAAALQSLGFLSPFGSNSFSYPGPVAIDYTGMIDRHP
jgi:hypothetical protein